LDRILVAGRMRRQWAMDRSSRRGRPAEDDPEGLAHHRHASVRFPPDPGALAAEV